MNGDAGGSHTVNMSVTTDSATLTANGNLHYTEHGDYTANSSGAASFHYSQSGGGGADVSITATNGDGSEDDGETLSFSFSESGDPNNPTVTDDTYSDTMFGPEYAACQGGGSGGGSGMPSSETPAKPLIDWSQTPTKGTDLTYGGVKGSFWIYKDSSGNDIKVWKANDSTVSKFNCHGLTFSGNAKGGPYAIDNPAVPTLLSDGYNEINAAKVKNGDILVYYDKAGKVIHSSTLVDTKLDSGKLDEAKSKVDSKNGQTPRRTESVEAQQNTYGPSSSSKGNYKIYRKK